MFKITGGAGFHIRFENGYTVSVQFGACTYSENHGYFSSDVDNAKLGASGSATAEVAVFKDGERGLLKVPEFNGDTVGGYYTPAQVLALLNWAASQ